MFKRCLLILGLALLGCNSSSVKEIKDNLDELNFDEPGRQPINTSILGTNAFVNDSSFGSISAQFLEVRDTLRINHVRVLFAWNDSVQPSPGSAPNMSFYDDILAALPPGMDALVILTALPSWMSDPANWTAGNARLTFVERWVRPVAQRYGANPKVVGFEIWNEPNNESFAENAVADVLLSPSNYSQMLSAAAAVVRAEAPGKLVVSGATTAINQNYPETLDYNRDMLAAGAQDTVDVYGIHVYGKQFENYIRDGGVDDFIDDLTKEVWVTESGAQGTNSQLPYAEQIWPFLEGRIPTLGRIYQYQFVENTPADVTYGMRNLTPGAELSDLYIFLRDR